MIVNWALKRRDNPLNEKNRSEEPDRDPEYQRRSIMGGGKVRLTESRLGSRRGAGIPPVAAKSVKTERRERVRKGT